MSWEIARLAVEPFAELRIGGDGFGQDFDRNNAIKARVAGAVDLSHAARAEGGEDFVGADPNAGCEAHTRLA